MSYIKNSPEPMTVNELVIRLGHEEVPLRVIARATQMEADDVRQVLEEAQSRAQIIRVPRDDWHPHPRGQLAPPEWLSKSLDDTTLTLNCQRLFKVTRLQASFLSPLIRRNEVTKEMLHGIVEDCRRTGGKSGREETDPKMVDVVICHLRKRVGIDPKWPNPFQFDIKTLRSSGYYLMPEDRKRAAGLIDAYINGVPVEAVNGEPDNAREHGQGAAGTPVLPGDTRAS